MMMRKRGVVFVVGLALVTAAAAMVQAYRLDVVMAEEVAAAARRDRAFADLDVALAEFRASQAGYVAAGQDPEFWFNRTADVLARLDETVAKLTDRGGDPTGQAFHAEMAALVASLGNLDGRARGYLDVGQRLLASDVIFLDGFDTAGRLATVATEARRVEVAASDARLARLGQFRLGLYGATVGGLGLLVLIFGRSALRPAAQALDDEDQDEPAAPEPAVPATAEAPPAPVAPEPAAGSSAPVINLAEAAELCVDLARLFDGRDVPPLFERACRVLGATGLVLWVADRGGSTLHVSLCHGYPEKVVAKLGTLAADGDNVTSLAFRTMRAQAVNGNAGGRAGAIAVPLITSAGCVGVLAAEVRQTRPDGSLLAVARMVAAQFAAVATPGDVEPSKAEAAEA